jgi:hypothetical protein
VNEAEWEVCDDPAAMLLLLGDRASGRKSRLFASACCRRLWDLLSDQHSQAAVVVAERFADGRATRLELGRARLEALKAVPRHGTMLGAAYAACWAAYWVANLDAPAFAARFLSFAELGGKLNAHADLLHCVFGNPLRHVSLNQGSLPHPLLTIAQAVYDMPLLPSGELSPVLLADLADAMEEAGLSSELVAHLRGPEPHVRGCFAVDLCLGLS